MILFHRRNYNDFTAISACSMQENKIKIKKVQRVCLILACMPVSDPISGIWVPAFMQYCRYRIFKLTRWKIVAERLSVRESK